MSEAARGIVISHASMAAGLITAVRQIAGVEEDVLIPLSNDGRSPDSLLDEITTVLGDTPAVLFTDLPSGSCAFAARKLTITRPKTAVVCGVSLPMLLDFVFHRELPLDQLVDRLVEKGRGSISGGYTETKTDVDRALSR